MGSHAANAHRQIKIEEEDLVMHSGVSAPISLDIPTSSLLPNKRTRKRPQVLDPSPIPASSPSGSAARTPSLTVADALKQAAAAAEAAESSAAAGITNGGGGGGATATVTITAKPIDLPLMLSSLSGPTTPNPAPTTSSSANSDCNVTDPRTGEVESLEQYMTCRKCDSSMRAVMRRHRVNGNLMQFPALRCTKKGCQTFKSLRAISGEVMPRTFVHSEERGDEEARACIQEWRTTGKSDETIREILEQIKGQLVWEKKSIEKRIRIMNELGSWMNELPPTLKCEMDADDLSDPSSRFSLAAMGGRRPSDFLLHLLKWDNEKRIRVEFTDVPEGYWSKEDFEFSSSLEAAEQKGLLAEASKQCGVNLDGLSDCCRQTARRASLLPSIDPSLSAEVFSRDAIDAAMPSPTESAGAVFKAMINQKKRMMNMQNGGGLVSAPVLAEAVQSGLRNAQLKEIEGFLKSGEITDTPPPAPRVRRLKSGQFAAAAAAAREDFAVPSPVSAPRSYNSLSKGLDQRKRSNAAAMEDNAPPPIKAWKKVNGEWRPMDVDDPSAKSEETKLEEYRERLEREEKSRGGKRRALKEEQQPATKARRKIGDEEAYRDWIIEERARMTQLAEIERDMDEQEMLIEDFEGSAPPAETPRKRSMRKKELEKRLSDLKEKKGWMENELDERRREMAVVKANIDAASQPHDLREALNGAMSGNLDVNALLLSISNASAESAAAENEEGAELEDGPPILSANDTIAGLLAKIKAPC